MQITIATVTFLVGLALVVVGIFGGGLEVKEVKIPTLPIIPRSMSFVAGCTLIALCLFFPQIFPSPAPAEKTVVADKIAEKSKVFLGAAITNQLVTVRDVKIILRRLKFYVGPIDDEPTPVYFQAVADFQAAQKIEADGYVGPVTYGKLRESWPDYFVSK